MVKKTHISDVDCSWSLLANAFLLKITCILFRLWFIMQNYASTFNIQHVIQNPLLPRKSTKGSL